MSVAPPMTSNPTEATREGEDFFDRLYGMTFRLFLDPNSEDGDGNTVKLRLGATVDNLALFETTDHAVLYSAATVDILRNALESSRETNNALVRRRCQMDDEIDALRSEVSRLKARIQANLDALEVPKMTETRAEYFKAGARAAIAAVNAALKDPAP